MPAEPVTILDGLVKGVILTAYDFARLTIANLLIPFVSKSRRFWPAVFSLQRRLSSLTFLVLWILLSISTLTGSSIELVSSAAGLEGKPDRNVFQNVALALVIAVIVDLGIRSCCLLIPNRIRREMYETLMRIATANIFCGAAFLPMIGKIFGDNILLILLHTWGFSFLDVYFSSPSLFLVLSSLPLGIIASKAFPLRLVVRKIVLVLLVATIVPSLLLSISLKAYSTVGSAGLWASMFPVQEVPHIEQKFTRCHVFLKQIHLSTFLLLKNAQSLVLDPLEFSIGVENRSLTKISDPQEMIVLTNVTFVRADVVTTINPEQENFPEGEFDCSLRRVLASGDDNDDDFVLSY